jgi:transposase
MTRVKLQILSLLKRRSVETPSHRGSWTKAFVRWLRETATKLDACVGPVLENLLARYELCQQQQVQLDKALRQLADAERYRAAVTALRKIPGVGLLTSLTFLTEMGDLNRFMNRREVTAYLGLCPSSHESGESHDRKGHITRQGPSRVRKLLCQAAWVGITRCPVTAQAYQRIRGQKANRTKKALVAMMRQLAIKMWHRAQAMGVSLELEGRGGPHSLE